MNKKLWEQLLEEADTNKDGVISFEEFEAAMGKTVKNKFNFLTLRIYEKNWPAFRYAQLP